MWGARMEVTKIVVGPSAPPIIPIEHASLIVNPSGMKKLVTKAAKKAKLEETRRLIEDKYNAEIAAQEQIKSAWTSVLDDVTSKLASLKASGLNPADIFERMGEQMSFIQQLEAKAAGETDLVKKAMIEKQIAAGYMTYLGMAEEAYSRPSSQYKTIYDMVVGKLGEIQTEAQEIISAADLEIISLNTERNLKLANIDLQLENLKTATIAQLTWLGGEVNKAETAIETMRDDYLGLIQGDISDIEQYIRDNLMVDIADIASDTIEGNAFLSDIASDISNLEPIDYTRKFDKMNGYLNDIEWNTRGYGMLPRHHEGDFQVPYTGYKAELSKDEWILTDEQRQGINVHFGDINIEAGSGANGEQIADMLKEKLEDEFRYGRLGKVIKEEVRAA